jgi:hypothetical protein
MTLPWVFASEATPETDALLDVLAAGGKAWVPALCWCPMPSRCMSCCNAADSIERSTREFLLALFGLSRRTLNDPQSVLEAVRTLAARLPTYITIKEVKRRWGHAQEDIFPVTQFEKLWGDMTSLPEASTEFFLVPRQRGQQLKEVAHLDGWDRDGSRSFIESLCEFV